MNWLEKNPVIATRQIDYLFTKFLGHNVIMSGMHIIGQIINYDETREFQRRCVQHRKTVQFSLMMPQNLMKILTVRL